MSTALNYKTPPYSTWVQMHAVPVCLGKGGQPAGQQGQTRSWGSVWPPKGASAGRSSLQHPTASHHLHIALTRAAPPAATPAVPAGWRQVCGRDCFPSLKLQGKTQITGYHDIGRRPGSTSRIIFPAPVAQQEHFPHSSIHGREGTHAGSSIMSLTGNFIRFITSKYFSKYLKNLIAAYRVLRD